MSTTAETLRRILAATPSVPDAAEPGVLLDAFVAVARARDRALAEIAGPLPLVDADDRGAWAELEALHAAWLAALDAARRQIAASLTGVRRLAAYHVKSDDGQLLEVG